MSKRKKLVIGVGCACVAALLAVGGMKIADVRASIRGAELLAEADGYRDLGLWYAAKPIYGEVMNNYPRNGYGASAKMGLAKCLEVTAPYDAIALYEQVAQACAGTETEADAKLAIACVLKIMNVNEALAQFEAMKTAYAGTEIAQRAHLGIAECLEAKGLFYQARAKYQEVADAYPDTAVAAESLYKLAECMYKPGVWKNPPPEQKPVLEKVLASEHASPSVKAEAKWLLALFYQNRKNVDEAEKVFRELVVEFPNTDRGLREFGTLAGMAMADNGIEACRELLQELATESAGTEIESAANDLLGLLEVPDMWSDTKEVPARILGVRANFYRKFNAELAVRAIRALVERYPDFLYAPDGLEALSEHLWRIGEYGQAVQELVRFEELYPGVSTAPDLLRFMALSYSRAGDDEMCVETLKRVIEKYPGSNMAAVAQYGIGRMYEKRLNDIAAARAAYEQTIATYPGTDQAQYASESLTEIGAG